MPQMKETKPKVAVDARRQQALTRPVEGQMGVEPGLRQPAGAALRVLAEVSDDTPLFRDGRDPQILAAGDAHPLAGLKEDTAQGRILPGIEPGLAGGREEDTHPAALDGRDQAKAEFGLSLAQPTLTGDKGDHDLGCLAVARALLRIAAKNQKNILSI